MAHNDDDADADADAGDDEQGWHKDGWLCQTLPVSAIKHFQ